MVRTGAKAGESAAKALKEVLDKAGLRKEDLTRIVSTGYGRVSISFADENVTEISCHGRGPTISIRRSARFWISAGRTARPFI